MALLKRYSSWAYGSRRFDDVQLTRLQGRPGELSPKARFWLFAGRLFPSRFKCVHLDELHGPLKKENF